MNSLRDSDVSGAPKAIGSEDGPKFFAPGISLQRKLSANDTFGMFSFHYSEVQPGFGPPMHMHTLEDEVFYVLEGQIEFVVGETKILATPGTTVYGPRGVKHKFKGKGETVSKMIGFVTGSNFERFYARFEQAMSADTPDMDEIGRIAEEHGIVLLAG